MADLKDQYKNLKSDVAQQQKDMGGTTAAQQENIQVRLQAVQQTMKLHAGRTVWPSAMFGPFMPGCHVPGMRCCLCMPKLGIAFNASWSRSLHA